MIVPVLIRKELSALETRGWLFAGRAAYVALLGLVLLPVFAQVAAADAATVGRRIFFSVMGAQIMVGLIMAASLASEAISSERKGRTLPLLLVTVFRPRDVVIGKAMANVLAVGLTVLAALPLLMVTILYGGVTLGQVVVAYACLAAVLVVSSAVGVAFSCLLRESGNAAGLTLLVTTTWLWWLPLLLPRAWGRGLARGISPWFCCFDRAGIGSPGSSHPVLCVTVAVVLALLALGLATRAVRRLAARGAEGSSTAVASTKANRRVPWCCSPLVWHSSGLATTTSRVTMQVVDFALVALMLLGCLLWCGGSDAGVGVCLAVVVALFVRQFLGLVGLCSRTIVRQKQDGTLALLLTTPLKERALLLGYLKASLGMMLPAALALHVLILLLRSSRGWSAADWVAGMELLGVSFVYSMLAVAVGVLVGLNASVLCRSTGAAGASTFVVLGLGTCVFTQVLALLSVPIGPRAGLFAQIAGMAVLVLCASVLFQNLVLTLRARLRRS